MQCSPWAAECVAQPWLPPVSWEAHAGEALWKGGRWCRLQVQLGILTVGEALVAHRCLLGSFGLVFVMLCGEFVGCPDVHNHLLELSALVACLVESVLSCVCPCCKSGLSGALLFLCLTGWFSKMWSRAACWIGMAVTLRIKNTALIKTGDCNIQQFYHPS